MKVLKEKLDKPPVVKQESEKHDRVAFSVEYKDHDKVVLTNGNGDTYTSKSEELMDFLMLSVTRKNQ